MTGPIDRASAASAPPPRDLLTTPGRPAQPEPPCAEAAPPARELLTTPADVAAARLASRIERASRALGPPLVLDGPAVLRQRSQLEGLRPACGTTSPGGGCHLLPCADGWVAISLARPADVDLLPAWLSLAGSSTSSAPAAPDDLAPLVAICRGRALAEAAAIVGLPMGVLGEVDRQAGDGTRVHDLGPRAIGRRPIRVLDLSALWAGPLCANVLGLTGASVTKVESTARPDASRTGNPRLFDHLNGDKADRTIDLSTDAGIDELRHRIRTSDVVVESARPRALQQLGIVALEELAQPCGPHVWVSITGHGRGSPRVAFGDDAAVAGGLVGWVAGAPRFAGDALADPLAGLTGAAAALEAIAAGRRVLVDVSLAHVAAAAADVGPVDLGSVEPGRREHDGRAR